MFLYFFIFLGPKSSERPLLTIGGWSSASGGAFASVTVLGSFCGSIWGPLPTAVGLSDFLGLPRLFHPAGYTSPALGPPTAALAGPLLRVSIASSFLG